MCVGVIAELQCVQRINPLSGAGVRARASFPRRFAFEARKCATLYDEDLEKFVREASRDARFNPLGYGRTQSRNLFVFLAGHGYAEEPKSLSYITHLDGDRISAYEVGDLAEDTVRDLREPSGQPSWPFDVYFFIDACRRGLLPNLEDTRIEGSSVGEAVRKWSTPSRKVNGLFIATQDKQLAYEHEDWGVPARGAFTIKLIEALALGSGQLAERGGVARDLIDAVDLEMLLKDEKLFDDLFGSFSEAPVQIPYPYVDPDYAPGPHEGLAQVMEACNQEGFRCFVRPKGAGG